MAEPGVAVQPPTPPGQEQYNYVLNQAGQKEADAYKAEETQRMVSSGVSPAAVAGYWGDVQPGDKDIDNHIANNMEHNGPAAAPKIASNPLEALKAGWDNSDLGLILNKRAPNVVTPQSAGLFDKISSAVGQTAGDIPFSVAGFLGGGAAGAAVPGADVTGVPEVIGAGFGAGATPQAVRSGLLTAYASGNYKNSHDLLVAVGKGTIDTLKAGTIGAVSNLVGGKVGEAVIGATGSKIIGGLANDAAQVTTAATTGAAMEGHLPEPSDFVTGAVVALGNRAGGWAAGKFTPTNAGARVQANLQKVYEETGIPPWEAAKLAQANPKLMQELTTQDVSGDAVTPGFKANAKTEPPHYGEPETGTEAWSTKRIDLATNGVQRLMDLTKSLEGSGVHAVSSAGAIGEHQIMPGTARQYGYDPARLQDPEYNRQVATAVLQHLNLKYQGDEPAVLAAYNAGPGRANELLRAGPGSRLEAEKDPHSPGGWRYESVPSNRDESFLPLETQRYIARGRLLAGDLKSSATSAPAEGEQPVAASTGLNEPEWAKSSKPEEEPAPKTDDEEALAREADAKATAEANNQGVWEGINAEFQRKMENAQENEANDKMAEAVAKAPSTGDASKFGDVNDAYKTIGDKIVDADAGSTDARPIMSRLGDMVSEFNPAREIDKHLAQYGFNPKTDIGVEDITRMTKGSYDKAAGMIKYGPIDPKTGTYDTNGPSIQKAFNMVKDAGGNLADWERYMVSQRSLTMEARNIKSGFDPNAAARIVTDAGERAKYEEATRHFNDALTGVLRYAQRQGLYSAEQVDRLVASNPTYLMFNRAQEAAAGLALAKGLNPQQVKALTGSDKPIVSPINSTLWNVFNIVGNADKNAATGYLVKLAEANMLPKDQAVTQESVEPEATVPEKILDAQMGAGDKGDTTFKYYRDGKAETWSSKDPDLARLLQTTKAGMDSPIVKLLSTFSGLERAGVLGDPGFPLRMMIRHQSMAYIMDPHNVTPYVHWIGGILDAFGQGPGYRRLLATNGMGAAMADLDVNQLHGDLGKVLDTTGFWDKALNVIGNPKGYPQALLGGVRFVQERLDAGARIGYENAVIAKGVDPLKAGMLARKLFIDYTEKSVDPILNATYSMAPFLKTHMIGTKTLLDSMIDRPVSTSVKIAASVAMPVAALFAANYLQDQQLPDDRKFSNIPRWEKDTFLITPEIGGQRIKIPLPPVIGPAVGGMMWRSLDAIMNHDPEAFKGWSETFLKQLIPDVTPTLLKPVLEAQTNYNFFSGKPLVPASLSDLSPDMQYTESTSAPAKALSRVLGDRVGIGIWNQSPIAIDNYVRGWGGTLGFTALKMLNMPFKDPGPPMDVADIPFVQSFVVRHPGAQAQSIEDFYDEEKKFTTAHADYEAAKKKLADGQEQEFNETSQDMRSFIKVAEFNKALKVQQLVLQGVYQDQKMSTDEKRQRIEQTYTDMIETAKSGLELMRGVDSGT